MQKITKSYQQVYSGIKTLPETEWKNFKISESGFIVSAESSLGKHKINQNLIDAMKFGTEFLGFNDKPFDSEKITDTERFNWGLPPQQKQPPIST